MYHMESDTDRKLNVVYLLIIYTILKKEHQMMTIRVWMISSEMIMVNFLELTTGIEETR